ncbi:hypothetical protein Q1695_015742 [Nippostrongylus brasiliensis]|nr:hypothetical protein Q1695_015742 [Nippostrongylus brasiliensis]
MDVLAVLSVAFPAFFTFSVVCGRKKKQTQKFARSTSGSKSTSRSSDSAEHAQAPREKKRGKPSAEGSKEKKKSKEKTKGKGKDKESATGTTATEVKALSAEKMCSRLQQVVEAERMAKINKGYEDVQVDLDELEDEDKPKSKK